MIRLVGFLYPGHLKKLLNQLALKVGSLVRMDTMRKTVYEKEVVPETMSDLLSSLILSREGMCHLREMIRHNENIHRLVPLFSGPKVYAD